MNCIIIDDENHCIKTLQNLLVNNFPEIRVVATCRESVKAYDLIMLHRPDFLFLDIEMPHLNGFDLLSKFEQLFFEVIFTTAYDSYAIKAIRYSALDYLMKPVSHEDLKIAADRIRNKQVMVSKTQLQMAKAVHNRLLPDTIALPTSEGLIFANVNDIVYCTADGGYTRLFMTGNQELLLSKTLGDVDELLAGYHFFRIHHSSLVNLRQVKKYIRGEGGDVVMSNGQTLQLARTRKADFLNVFLRF